MIEVQAARSGLDLARDSDPVVDGLAPPGDAAAA